MTRTMQSPATTALRRCLILIVAIAIVACAWLPQIQRAANAQVDAGLKRALISFASARTLNAIISVVQGTEIAVEPLGVGITLTPGQILDPINDLVEQFSSLMLVASVAFGIQKLLLAIGGHWLVSAVTCGVVAVWAMLMWIGKSPGWLSRAVLVLVMIRFAIPVATLGSDLIFQQLLSKDYQEQQALLASTARDVQAHIPQAQEQQTSAAQSTKPQPADDRSQWEKLKGKFKDVASIPSFDFEPIKKSVEDIPERIVKLIVIFLAQTIIIPVALLWAMYRTLFGVFRSLPASRPGDLL